MSRSRRSTAWGVLAASLFLGAASVFTVAGPASANLIYSPRLNGDVVVPGPGDPDAEGAPTLQILPADGTVCVESWNIVGLDEQATAAHIHLGAAGASGDVVVTLPTPEPDGTGGGCVKPFDFDSPELQAIVDDPGAYYVDVHTAGFEDGAIR
jgi:hypothetical protein